MIFHFSPIQNNKNRRIGQSNRGQIVVEYVLLMILGISIALLIITLSVSRNPDNPGFIIQKWYEIINFIGNDTADDITPNES